MRSALILTYAGTYRFAYRELRQRGTVSELVGGGLFVCNSEKQYVEHFSHAQVRELDAKLRADFLAEAQSRVMAVRELQHRRGAAGLPPLRPEKILEHFGWEPLELPPDEEPVDLGR